MFPLGFHKRKQCGNELETTGNEAETNAETCIRVVSAPKCLEEFLRGIASRIGKGPNPRTSSGVFATELHRTKHWSTPSRMPQRAPRQASWRQRSSPKGGHSVLALLAPHGSRPAVRC